MFGPWPHCVSDIMATVSLRRLSKVYGGVTPAVDRVTLDVEDGEFFVLLGPSGCGKSTVLRMVAGLESVSSGEVWIDGVLANAVKSSERDVAMVFQTGALYPHMTVAENIGFPLRLAREGRRRTRARVREAAALLGITDLLQRLPTQLSGGQRQRVALGRAIVRHPQLFLMDEPMSNLDAALRAEIRADIARLQRRLGTTTIYVTHDQVEAMTMGDRIAVLRDGRVVQTGHPLDVYAAPTDLFVASFLGFPSMGLVKARVDDRNDSLGLEIGTTFIPFPQRSHLRLPGLDALVGREVVMGVRAEDVRVDGTADLIGSAVHVEQLGHQQLVHVALDAEGVVATDYGIESDRERDTFAILDEVGRSVGIWEPLPLHIDLAKVHLFDLHTGAALARTAA